MTEIAGSISERPYWWEADELSDPGEPADVPSEVDVAVIGGGLTGLSAARTLAQRGASVAVLERHEIGYGASTRNGGMIGNGHRLGILDAQRKYGDEIGRGLIEESNAAYDFVTDVIEKERIDCDFVRHGRLMTAWTKKNYETLARTVDLLRRSGADDVELLSREDLKQEIETPLYEGGCLYRSHGGLHPFKYHRGFVTAARRHGAALCRHTPALGLSGSEGRYVLDVPGGSLRAAKIVVATNGYTPTLIRRIARRLIPVPSFVIATEEIGENRARALMPGGRMMVETRARHAYYRLSPDGNRLLIGGRAALTGISPEKALGRMRSLMTEIFPSLTDVALTHSWRGQLGFTFSGLPSIGAQDGIHHAVGFNGSGNAMAPYLGHKAALQVLGDPEGDTVFRKTPFPGRPYYQGRAWFMPLADAHWRLKDRLDSLRRRRE